MYINKKTNNKKLAFIDTPFNKKLAFIDTLFKALDSTCSRLHQRLQNSCKAPAISSRHDLKSIGTGNLYLGPLHIIDRILESYNHSFAYCSLLLECILLIA